MRIWHVGETNREVAIRECMERLGKRYRQAQGQTTTISITSDAGMARCAEVRRQLREWFEDRMEYLQEEYRKAINDADNIIGKQWHYDGRPKL